MAKAAGFYHTKENTSVFYDQGTNREYEVLDKMNADLDVAKQKAIRARSAGAKDLVRFTNTIQLLTKVAKENSDIEVVSHEATHHMAAATGLMPNKSPVPLWAAEGLATYFESPSEAAWAGIGTVNKQRLDWYRALAGDREHSNVKFVVSDKVFSHAASDGAIAHAYGQAWALTHFLMEHHFDELMRFYQLIAKKESEKQLSSKEYEEVFEEAFGKNTSVLEAEWRRYMQSLKTDIEKVLAEK